jgi:hypothetical protein
MKKIVLTLGIFLSAYATYAVNSSIEFKKNFIEEEGPDGCYRIVNHFDHANNWIGVSVFLC